MRAGQFAVAFRSLALLEKIRGSFPFGKLRVRMTAKNEQRQRQLQLQLQPQQQQQ